MVKVDDEFADHRTLKLQRRRRVLSCHYCAPHRGENRERLNGHKTRKSRNFQFVVSKASSRRG
jgi:hypothetical protein